MLSADRLIERLVASPCCLPQAALDELLDSYSGIGFRKFEAFSSWCASAFDPESDPSEYRRRLESRDMRCVSFHLPKIGDDAESVARAIAAARFAAALGARIVLYKADSIEAYIRAAKPFLDSIEGLGLTPVVQNHFGTALSSLDDVRRALDGIADARMQGLLEVGQFHSAGVHWLDGCNLLKDRIALVHIKDQIGRQSVPFGRGQIDLIGLFRHLESEGYAGDYVIEMEVKDRENTFRYLREAVEYLRSNLADSQT
ncbi:MAG: Inosose dehydratase [candidate division BRC1 bacterium ADurb.BinA364]|nr:MAG: Inosose dehydratase [candidate division BRC1 bacterium ADurb.BinA364]